MHTFGRDNKNIEELLRDVKHSAEGLGNQPSANIREVALLHVVRCREQILYTGMEIPRRSLRAIFSDLNLLQSFQSCKNDKFKRKNLHFEQDQGASEELKTFEEAETRKNRHAESYNLRHTKSVHEWPEDECR